MSPVLTESPAYHRRQTETRSTDHTRMCRNTSKQNIEEPQILENTVRERKGAESGHNEGPRGMGLEAASRPKRRPGTALRSPGSVPKEGRAFPEAGGSFT